MTEMHKTTNYSMFAFTKENRRVDLTTSEARALGDSMADYGFLPAFPIMVRERGNKLVVIDGQHRLSVAQEFGLPVYYVIDNQDVEIARINKAQRKWTPLDFAQRWAAEGLEDYIDLISFHAEYGIHITASAAMLAGTMTFDNVKAKFQSGRFEIRQRASAASIAKTFNRLCAINPEVRVANFLGAIYAASWLDYFDPKRLIATAEKKPELLAHHAKRDGFLDVLEDLHNHFRRAQDQRPLKFDAQRIMAARSAAKSKARS